MTAEFQRLFPLTRCKPYESLNCDPFHMRQHIPFKHLPDSMKLTSWMPHRTDLVETFLAKPGFLMSRMAWFQSWTRCILLLLYFLWFSQSILKRVTYTFPSQTGTTKDRSWRVAAVCLVATTLLTVSSCSDTYFCRCSVLSGIPKRLLLVLLIVHQ